MRQGKILPIPEDISDIYIHLRSEITWLHGRWIIYRQLYAESEKRILLLNETAGSFFYIVQEILYNDIQVSLSKLTDPSTAGGFDNLALETLYEKYHATSDQAISADLRELLDKLHEQCRTFRKWRNKKHAHLDLAVAMELSDPLPGVSRAMIEEALDTVRLFMNKISIHYDDTEFGYEHFLMRSGGDHLIAVLKNGLRYEEKLQDRSINYDDWRKGEWHDA